MPPFALGLSEIHERVARTGVPERFEQHMTDLGRWLTVRICPVDCEHVAITYEEPEERSSPAASLDDEDERQAFLLKLSDALRPLVDPLATQQAALALLAERMAVDRASFYEPDGDRETLRVAATHARGGLSRPGAFRLPDLGFGRDGERYGPRGCTIRDIEVNLSEAHRDAHRTSGSRAFATVALLKGGDAVAILGIHLDVPRDWSTAEARLVEEVAERTGRRRPSVPARKRCSATAKRVFARSSPRATTPSIG